MICLNFCPPGHPFSRLRLNTNYTTLETQNFASQRWKGERPKAWQDYRQVVKRGARRVKPLLWGYTNKELRRSDRKKRTVPILLFYYGNSRHILPSQFLRHPQPQQYWLRRNCSRLAVHANLTAFAQLYLRLYLRRYLLNTQ